MTKKRHRSKGLFDADIFDRVINAKVAFQDGNRRVTGSRLETTVRILAMQAIQGSIDAANRLLIMHTTSTKQGDFKNKIVRLHGDIDQGEVS